MKSAKVYLKNNKFYFVPTAAKDISDLADGINYRDKPRSELLFPAGTDFKLIAKYPSPDGSGVWRILLEEL